MKKVMLIAVALFTALEFISMACVPVVTSASAATVRSRQPAATQPAQPAWETKWDKVVADAKKEGAVVLYTTAGAEARRAISEAFKSKYGINVDFIAGRGAQLSARLQKEYAAGVYQADIINTGGGSLLGSKNKGLFQPLKPRLILPEVLDDKAWVIGRLPFLDTETYQTFGLLAFYETNVARNTNMVQEKEITKLRDLLDPKWKGQLLMLDPTTTGPGAFFTTFVSRKLGKDALEPYLTGLAKQETVITKDYRVQIEWLAKGKYPIVIGVSPEVISNFIRLGSPIANVPLDEGGAVETGGGGLAMAARPAHPNAATVFVNWILSKEGHAVYIRALKVPGARVDAPTEEINTDFILKPEKKFVYADEDYFTEMRSFLIPLNKKIFGPLMK